MRTPPRIVKAYDDYDYPAIQAANQLITVDLSAFYVDVTKDRCTPSGPSRKRARSGQTAMYIIVDGLARLLAPVLSVTMDELWQQLPGQREESVHMALFPRDLEQWKDDALIERWAKLSAVRDQVNSSWKKSGRTRPSGESVGKGELEAEWRICEAVVCVSDFLPTLFGVSG